MSQISSLNAIALKPGLSQLRREMILLEEMLAARRTERMCRDIKYQLAAARFETALIRYAYVCRKAGFRHDQPRWPKGSGEDSGRWSGGAGTGAPGIGHNSGAITRGGHHFVNQKLYESLPLRPETRKVFDEARTGPLKSGPHGWSKEHKIYNEAVAEHFNRFLKENGIQVENMTPEEARKFVDEVKRSNDPRIRGLNMRIYMREIMYYLRRTPRRGE